MPDQNSTPNPFDALRKKTLPVQSSVNPFDALRTPEPSGLKGRTFRGTIKDAGITAAHAGLDLLDVPVGLANLGVAGLREHLNKRYDIQTDPMLPGAMAEKIGYRPRQWHESLEKKRSAAHQLASAKFAEAKGIGEKTKAAIANPSLIAHAVARSAPMILGGAAAARIGVKLGMAAIPAAAAGEGVMQTGSHAEQTRQETGGLTGEQAGHALSSGGIDAVISLFGGKLAKKVGLADVDVLLAGGKTNPTVRRALLTQVAGSGALEASEEVLQGAQGQILQNKSLGRPLTEGIDETVVMGALSGFLTGSAGGYVSADKSPMPPSPRKVKVNDDPSEGMMEAGAEGVREAMADPEVSPERTAPPSPRSVHEALRQRTSRFVQDLETGAASARPNGTQPPRGFRPTSPGLRLNTVPRNPRGFTTDINPFDELRSVAGKPKPVETQPPIAGVDEAAKAAEFDRELGRAVTPDPQLVAGIADDVRAEDLTKQAALRALTGVKRRPKPEAEPSTVTPPSDSPVAIESPALVSPMATEPLPSYPEGMAMGGIEGRIPDVPKQNLPKSEPIEGLQQSLRVEPPEPAAATKALRPNKYLTHSVDDLANATLAAQARIEAAQEAQGRASQRGLVGEKAQADMENRGTTYSDESEGSTVTADRELARAKADMALIERAWSVRGVAGEDLADVIRGAKETRAEREGMAGEETLAALKGKDDPFGENEPAPVAEPVAADAAPAQADRNQQQQSTDEQGDDARDTNAQDANTSDPFEGTGETKTRGVALSTEAKAVEAKLIKGFEGLPDYKVVNFAEQAQRAVALLDRDPDFARRIALGDATAPHGLLPEQVFIAVENRAIAQGDVETLHALATGRLTEEGTLMGQRIASYRARDPESPVHAIKSVREARSNGRHVQKATDSEVSSLEKRLNDVNISSGAWNEFIDSLRC